MLKAGTKRRRTQEEIKYQKEEEDLRKQSIEEKLARFDELARKYEQLQDTVKINDKAAGILNDMINRGEAELDNTGNVKVRKSIGVIGQTSQQNEQQMVDEDYSESSQIQM